MPTYQFNVKGTGKTYTANLRPPGPRFVPPSKTNGIQIAAINKALKNAQKV